jgi:HlyD family secretion protein
MTSKQPDAGSDISEVLNIGKNTTMRRVLPWFVLAPVVLMLAGGVYLLLKPGKGAAVNYESAKVERGDLTVTVTATGTLEPVNQVDVGSELSGIIETVEVDFNDQVKRGQVLARLDTDRLQAQVIQARASLESAKARLDEAKATVVETRLRYERCEKLVDRQLCSREELDTNLAAHTRAQANEASTLAQVAVARATLDGHETELAKAEIRSPIDGLVLQRQIEPGQTVAASLQAPVLFTLAEDLANMELHVAVDEADVGKIAEQQNAVFTVDAYPDRSFPARITQVRFAPQTVEGVVTYETVLMVDNSDLSLRPGMTATAVVTVEQLQNVILVPNAALRFTPPETKTAEKAGGGVFGSIFRRPFSNRKLTDAERNIGKSVWVLEDGEPVAVEVKTGASDGRFTELRSGEIQAGDEVLVDATIVTK